jgi:CBS domain-containing protein/anti-sigma regulatory factor (Ser/Thr protein kinase)
LTPPARRKTSRDTQRIFISKVQEMAYEMKVSQVMTSDVVTVPPGTTMDKIRQVMQERRISGIPVVQDGKVLGMISIEDLIRCLAEPGEVCETGIVDNIMSREVVSIYADDPVTRAVNLFDQTGYGRFPVVDRASGKLLGLITKGNIVGGFLKHLEVAYHEEEIHQYRASHFFEDIVADKTSIIFHYGVKAGDFSLAGRASSGLKKSLTRLGMKPEHIRRVAIACYETEMNMVIYTNGGRITAEVTPEVIKVTARDVGPGIPDVDKAMQVGYSTAQSWVREMGFGAGMGLPNIKKCSDHMTIDTEIGVGSTIQFLIGTSNDDRE